MNRLKETLKNERGQGMLEYVLLLAIVAVLILAFKTQIKGIFEKATNQLGDSTGKVFTDN